MGRVECRRGAEIPAAPCGGLGAALSTGIPSCPALLRLASWRAQNVKAVVGKEQVSATFLPINAGPLLSMCPLSGG